MNGHVSPISVYKCERKYHCVNTLMEEVVNQGTVGETWSTVLL